jgi:flagellar protein FliO/FliZ
VLGEDAPAAAVPGESGGGAASAFAIFRVVLVLALAAGAVYGLVFLLKRTKKGGAPDDGYLKELAKTPINLKNAVAVIAVGSKAWLVGLSDTNVSAIAEITDQEAVDAMLLDYSQRAAFLKNAGPVNFKSILRRFAGGAIKTNTETPTVAGIPQTENLQKNRDRLRGL